MPPFLLAPVTPALPWSQAGTSNAFELQPAYRDTAVTPGPVSTVVDPFTALGLAGGLLAIPASLWFRSKLTGVMQEREVMRLTGVTIRKESYCQDLQKAMARKPDLSPEDQLRLEVAVVSLLQKMCAPSLSSKLELGGRDVMIPESQRRAQAAAALAEILPHLTDWRFNAAVIAICRAFDDLAAINFYYAYAGVNLVPVMRTMGEYFLKSYPEDFELLMGRLERYAQQSHLLLAKEAAHAVEDLRVLQSAMGDYR